MNDPFEYAKQRIINAPVLEEPYPHMLIDEIFPEWYYKELIKNIPKREEYTPKPKYPGRQTLTLDNFDYLNEEKRKFWEKMFEWLKSSEFAELLLKKYSIKKKGYSGFFLHKDLQDFEVKPHVDVRSKLVTYLFYLPKDDSLPDLGTSVLVAKKGKEIQHTTKHQEWENFDIVKKSKYIPNSFFSFTPCENSYHAVKIKFPPESKINERDTIRGFVFDKETNDYPNYLFEKKVT
jgi:hypothetical protein